MLCEEGERVRYSPPRQPSPNKLQPTLIVLSRIVVRTPNRFSPDGFLTTELRDANK